MGSNILAKLTPSRAPKACPVSSISQLSRKFGCISSGKGFPPLSSAWGLIVHAVESTWIRPSSTPSGRAGAASGAPPVGWPAGYCGGTPWPCRLPCRSSSHHQTQGVPKTSQESWSLARALCKLVQRYDWGHTTWPFMPPLDKESTKNVAHNSAAQTGLHRR